MTNIDKFIERIDSTYSDREKEIYNRGARFGKIDCLNWLYNALENLENDLDVATLRNMLKAMYEVSIQEDLENDADKENADSFTEKCRKKMGI